MKEFVNDSNIFTVDALYYEPELAAIHLVRSNDRIAIVDTGTQYSVDQVRTALAELGLGFDNVDYIILTHIHLDHAGGASSLMQLCANAKLIVHKKGARHMANPEKLVAGSKEVYGEEEFRTLYGEITPIEESRIYSPEENEVIEMSGREFMFMDSPGHASHHHCILDKQTNSVFTGDTLGISYLALRDPDHSFVMPTTTPVQFNPEALHHSIDKIMAHSPEYLYLTHYSAIKPNAQNIAGLHEQIEDYVMLTEKVASDSKDNFESVLSEQLFQYSVRRAENELSSVDLETIQHWVKLDSNLSAQGLAFWWQYRRTS